MKLLPNPAVTARLEFTREEMGVIMDALNSKSAHTGDIYCDLYCELATFRNTLWGDDE